MEFPSNDDGRNSRILDNGIATHHAGFDSDTLRKPFGKKNIPVFIHIPENVEHIIKKSRLDFLTTPVCRSDIPLV